MYLRKNHPWNPGYAISGNTLTEGPRAKIAPGLPRKSGGNKGVPFFSPGLPRRTIMAKQPSWLVEGKSALGGYGSLGSDGYGSLGDTRTRVVDSYASGTPEAAALAAGTMDVATAIAAGKYSAQLSEAAFQSKFPSEYAAWWAKAKIGKATGTSNMTYWSIWQGKLPYRSVGNITYNYGNGRFWTAPSTGNVFGAIVDAGKDLANGVKNLACQAANSATVGVIAGIAGGPSAGGGVSAVSAACSGGGGTYVPVTPPATGGSNNMLLLLGGAALVAFIALKK